MPRQKIKIVLPDGKEKEGTSFETTALDIAKSLSNSLVFVGANIANAFSGQDATSAITFLSPGTWILMICPVWHVCNMRASPLSNLPAVGYIDLEAMRSIHPTVGLLLHSVPSVLCFIAGASDRMTPHC